MDPVLGRFVSRDPIGLWGDAANLGNGYTYAASNPWSLVDPFGLASGGNMAALRAEYEALQDNRSRESFWAGVGGFFSFGREDAVLATEAVSYIPIVGWGADAVLLAEAIERGDTFDTIMAGIGFIPILGDGAKAIVDTGGRVIRGFKGLRIAEKASALNKQLGNRGAALNPFAPGALKAGGTPSKNSLLPGEGKVGTFGDLIDAGEAGDNLTPHHIPSKKHMEKHSVSRDDGLAINMEHPYPGVGGRHRSTFTYGTQADVGMSARNALAAGVRDTRSIYRQQGLYTPEIREALQNFIRQSLDESPAIFGKK